MGRMGCSFGFRIGFCFMYSFYLIRHLPDVVLSRSRRHALLSPLNLLLPTFLNRPPPLPIVLVHRLRAPIPRSIVDGSNDSYDNQDDLPREGSFLGQLALL